MTTAFGDVTPGVRFNDDANGRSSPHGHTVTNPDAVASVPVTFSATAAASAGTPARPATVTSMVWPAMGLSPVYPRWGPSGRVSSTRLGLAATIVGAAGAPGAAGVTVVVALMVGAGAKAPFPPWFAVTVHAPGPATTTTRALSPVPVHAPVATRPTSRPVVACAATGNELPGATVAGGAVVNAIVWGRPGPSTMAMHCWQLPNEPSGFETLTDTCGTDGLGITLSVAVTSVDDTTTVSVTVACPASITVALTDAPGWKLVPVMRRCTVEPLAICATPRSVMVTIGNRAVAIVPRAAVPPAGTSARTDDPAPTPPPTWETS